MSWTDRKSWRPWPERFWEKVDKSERMTSCWLWTASKNTGGYGHIYFDGHLQIAHRLSAEMAGMTISGTCVLHRCDVRACVNPEHLFLGSREDNNADRTIKDRSATRLTRASVVEIRHRYPGETLEELAQVFGVARPTIWRVVHRETWKHIA